MGFVRRLSGKGVEKAAKQGSEIQAQAGLEAIKRAEEAAARGQEFLDPFAAVGQQGVDQAGFLANPQAQFDFLQSNPLFDLALQNANTVTQKSAASRGRLNAGDTLEQLSNNVLLSASPLIDRQRQDINNLLNLGTGIAGSQANIETGLGATTGGLITDIGSARSAGLVGGANASAAGAGNLLGAALQIGPHLPGLIRTGAKLISGLI